MLGFSSNEEGELDTPEERLARRISHKFSLKPRVDVELLAKRMATVCEKEFPLEIDGICLDLKKSGTKPEIWINRRLGHHRKRFTLAHEIGHVIIPWHVGAIVDAIELNDDEAVDSYWKFEKEANRFAAELLMPRKWVSELCGRAEHMRDVMHTVAQIADVSLSAAALRTIEIGPPGYLFAAVDRDIVISSGKTSGTTTRAPFRGQNFESIELSIFREPKTLSYNSIIYYWWQECGHIPVPPKPEQQWRKILDSLTIVVPETRRQQTRQQLNAIVGLAIGKVERGGPVGPMYRNVLESLQNRNDENPYVAQAVRDPVFLEYALARIYERSETI